MADDQPLTVTRRLTGKQEAFIRAYLTNGRNASAAYRSAYDNHTMSDEAVRVEAHRTLNVPNVSLRIQSAIQRAARKTDVTIERVVEEWALVAFQRANDIYAEDGSILPPDQWDDATAATIAGVEVFEEFEGSGENRTKVGETRKVKRWDKMRALADLKELLSGGSTVNVLVGAMTDEERGRRIAELVARGRGRCPALPDAGGAGGTGPTLDADGHADESDAGTG